MAQYFWRVRPVLGPPNYPGALVRSITSHTTGKLYFEMTLNVASVVAAIGIGVDDGSESLVLPGGQTGGIVWAGNGNVKYNGLANAYHAAPFSVGSICGIAVDITNSKIYFTPDGAIWNANGSASPAGNTGGFSIASIAGSMFAMAQLSQTNDQVTANFTGSSPAFTYSAPAGFSAWG